jgi:hypothetical protein
MPGDDHGDGDRQNPGDQHQKGQERHVVLHWIIDSRD